MRNPLRKASPLVQALVAFLAYVVVEHIMPTGGAGGVSLAALVLVNAGEVRLLENFVNKTAPENKSLRLFKSNTTPAETDTAGTYTEATFTGYAAVTLTGASWTVNSGAPGTASYAAQTFTSSANQTAENVYGYYVLEATAGTLDWAERFTGAPYVIQNLNDAIAVTPQFTAD